MKTIIILICMQSTLFASTAMTVKSYFNIKESNSREPYESGYSELTGNLSFDFLDDFRFDGDGTLLYGMEDQKDTDKIKNSCHYGQTRLSVDYTHKYFKAGANYKIQLFSKDPGKSNSISSDENFGKFLKSGIAMHEIFGEATPIEKLKISASYGYSITLWENIEFTEETFNLTDSKIRDDNTYFNSDISYQIKEIVTPYISLYHYDDLTIKKRHSLSRLTTGVRGS